MRVILAHGVADRAGRLAIGLVMGVAGLVHGEKHAGWPQSRLGRQQGLRMAGRSGGGARAGSDTAARPAGRIPAAAAAA